MVDRGGEMGETTPASCRPVSDPGPPSRAIRILLRATLLAAFLLRAWYTTPNLTYDRWWDERYLFDNTDSILNSGRWQTVNAYYPGLGYLPQVPLLAASDALARFTRIPAFAIHTGRSSPDQMTPTAYLICRMTSVVFGTVSLWLVFQIGCRLFSPLVGLIATILLAAMPFHIFVSGIFKPDSALVCMTLLAFHFSLRAASDPRRSHYLAAGAAIGLAASAKQTGVAAALPLILVGLRNVRRQGRWDRRQLISLVLAGVVAALVFVALNPDLGLMLRHLEQTRGEYEEKARERGALTRSSMLGRVGGYFLEPTYHGVVIGSLSFLGALALGLGLVERERRKSHGLERLMVLSYPVAYVGLWTWSTAWSTPHCFVVIAPFTSLCAAWIGVSLWEAAAARIVWLGRHPGVAVTGLVLALLPVARGGVGYVQSCLPSTGEVAQTWVARDSDMIVMREVYYERGDEANLWQWLRATEGSLVLTREVERLSSVPPDLLDLVDHEVFLEARRSGPQAPFYEARIDRSGPRALTTVRPHPFTFRGPALAVLEHRWEAPEPVRAVELNPTAPGGRQVAAILPDRYRAGDVLSLEVQSRTEPMKRDVIGIRVGAERMAMSALDKSPGSDTRYLTRRFRLKAARSTVVFEPPAASWRPVTTLWIRRFREPGWLDRNRFTGAVAVLEAVGTRGDPGLTTDGETPPDGTVWDSPQCLILNGTDSSVTVAVPPGEVVAFQVSADHNDIYGVECRRDGAEFVAIGTIGTTPFAGVATRLFASPALDGCRALRIRPVSGDGSYSVCEIDFYIAPPGGADSVAGAR